MNGRRTSEAVFITSPTRRFRWKPLLLFVGALGLLVRPVAAQETSIHELPNTLGASIQKSLAEEIGAGRGNVTTPGSSIFIIERDPFRSIVRGRQLFQRKFTVAQGVGPRVNDGIGAFNQIAANPDLGAGLADSCASCHARPPGSAGFGGATFTRPDSRDSQHLFGLGLQEMLADEITTDLRAIRGAALAAAVATGQNVTRPLISKDIGYGSLIAHPDGAVDTAGVEGVNPDLRVRPFMAHGQFFSIREFVNAATQAELGLQAIDPDMTTAGAGGRVVTPSGLVLDGALDQFFAIPVAHDELDDPDHDGVANEFPTSLVDHMEFYLLHYFTAATYQQTHDTRKGRELMDRIGCTSCHMPNLLIEHDRRVAHVDTVYDPERGIFNNLFATARTLFTSTDDHTGFPTLKRPNMGPFLVQDIFTDFKRHDLGPNFHERQFDGRMLTHFQTRPLWGVGSTAPYGHDGRSLNLREVILRHGGEAQTARDAFAKLPEEHQQRIIAFLQTLVLFSPPNTASNLNPGNRNAAGFPQNGHGSINLGVLFNDPADRE